MYSANANSSESFSGYDKLLHELELELRIRLRKSSVKKILNQAFFYKNEVGYRKIFCFCINSDSLLLISALLLKMIARFCLLRIKIGIEI
jgi:hypothetical protein